MNLSEKEAIRTFVRRQLCDEVDLRYYQNIQLKCYRDRRLNLIRVGVNRNKYAGFFFLKKPQTFI